MLLSVAWRNTSVRDDWRKEMCEKLKLLTMKMIVECQVESSCVFLKLKVERKMMLNFMRGGTVVFQTEIGRWLRVKREDREDWCAKSVTVHGELS